MWRDKLRQSFVTFFLSFQFFLLFLKVCLGFVLFPFVFTLLSGSQMFPAFVYFSSFVFSQSWLFFFSPGCWNLELNRKDLLFSLFKREEKQFYHPPFVPSSLKIMWAGSISWQNYLLTCPNCKSIKYSFVSANTTLSHFTGFLGLWNSVKNCGLPQANYFICHQRSLRRGCQQIFIFPNFFFGGKFVFSELQPQPEDQCEKKNKQTPKKSLTSLS